MLDGGRTALAAASARLWTPSLARMRLTWWPAVLSLIDRVRPMLRVGHPQRDELEHLLFPCRSARRPCPAAGPSRRPGRAAPSPRHPSPGQRRAPGRSHARCGPRPARAREPHRPVHARAPGAPGPAPNGIASRLNAVSASRAGSAASGGRPAATASRAAARSAYAWIEADAVASRQRGQLGHRGFRRRRHRRTASRASTSGARRAAARTALSVDAEQSSLEQCGRLLRVRPRPCGAGRGRAARRVLLAPSEQALRIEKPAPQDAQLGQGRDSRRAHLRDEAGMDGERRFQRVLGLGPVTGGEQHVGVHRPAGTEQRLGAVLAGELADELAPLAPALPLTGTLQPSMRLQYASASVCTLRAPPGRCGSHRLLEQAQPVLLAPGAHDSHVRAG